MRNLAAALLAPIFVASAAVPAASQARLAETPVQQVAAALTIAELGRKERDARLLASAARVLLAVGLRGDERSPAPETALALLDEAERLATGDAEALRYIREVRQQGDRGVLQGVRQTVERVQPGQAQRFAFVFAGREVADVGIRLRPGSEGAQLAVRALDDRGRPVAAERLRDRSVYVEWTPRECGRFVVEVRNMSQRPAEFLLTTAPSKSSASQCAGLQGGKR